MKQVYNILVDAKHFTKLENIFNRFRIGFNRWDKTRIMNVNGTDVVNYTVVCTEDDYNDIITALNS